MKQKNCIFLITGVFKYASPFSRLFKIYRVMGLDYMRRASRQLISAVLTTALFLVVARAANLALQRDLRAAVEDPLNSKFHNFCMLFQNKENVAKTVFAAAFVSSFELYELNIKPNQRDIIVQKYGDFFAKIIQNNELVFYYEKIIQNLLKNALFLRITDIICNFKTIVYSSPQSQKILEELDIVCYKNLSNAYKQRDIERQRKTLPGLLLPKQLVKDEEAKLQLIEKIIALETYIDTELTAIFLKLNIFVQQDVKKALCQFILISTMTAVYESILEDVKKWESDNLQLVNRQNLQFYNIEKRRYNIMNLITANVAYSLLSHCLVFSTLNDYMGTDLFQIVGQTIYAGNPRCDLYDAVINYRNAISTQNYRKYYSFALPGIFLATLVEVSHNDQFGISGFRSYDFRSKQITDLTNYTRCISDIQGHLFFRILLFLVLLYNVQAISFGFSGLANLFRATRGMYMMCELPYGEFYALLMSVQVTVIFVLYYMLVGSVFNIVMSPTLPFLPFNVSLLESSHVSMFYTGLLSAFFKNILYKTFSATLITIVVNTLILWAFDEYEAWNAQFIYNYVSNIMFVLSMLFLTYYSLSQVTRIQFGLTPLKAILNGIFDQLKNTITKTDSKNLNLVMINLKTATGKPTGKFVYAPVYIQMNRSIISRIYNHFAIVLFWLVLLFFLFVKPYVIKFVPTQYTPMY